MPLLLAACAGAAPPAPPLAPVDGLALADGRPLVVAGQQVFWGDEPVGTGAWLAARIGRATWVVGPATGGDQATLRGPGASMPLRSLVHAYGLDGDDQGVVAWGLDNDSPSGTTWGWVSAAGGVRWDRVIHGRGYASFLAGQVAGDLVALAGCSDDDLGNRYRNWVVGLDRVTGETRWDHTLGVGNWAVPVVLLDDPGGFLVVGHTADSQPSMVVSAAPYLVRIGRNGAVGAPTVLDTDLRVQLEDAARGPDGTLWLVGTALANGGSFANGPWLGAVGRVEGDRVTWRAVPGCRPATEIEADAKQLWLAGHDGAQRTGWLEAHPFAAFDTWDPPARCPGA